MGRTTKVIDGLPYRLAGAFVDGEARLRFKHKCCHCGTRHQVLITKKPRTADMSITYKRLENKKKTALRGNATKIGDQEIIGLDGVSKPGGEAHVRFVHWCNDCGLEHNVHIKKKPRTANMDITFVRVKKRAGENTGRARR